MNRSSQSQVRSFASTLIADTSDRFSDFTPYVPSINKQGLVAFQAALRSGGAGIFTGDGGPITTIDDMTRGLFRDFYSHPDVNSEGEVSYYADLKLGGQAIVRIRDGQVTTVADTNGPFTRIGPLGPTMNDGGVVAFRAGMKSGQSGVFTGGPRGSILTIADTSGVFGGFQGLPVVNSHGAVVFRADRKDGGRGIYVGSGGSLAPIVDTSAVFSDIALFPCINDQGAVVFNATLKAGGAGIFTAKDGQLAAVVETNGHFESLRGALISSEGTVVFFATPRGGELGVYAGPDPVGDRIISIGDPLFGSAVAEFALNSVSLNDAGQVALRVRLANDRQLILRMTATPAWRAQEQLLRSICLQWPAGGRGAS